MRLAEHSAPQITEPLTWAQICEQYPEQWVCVVDIVWHEVPSLHFRHARVVGVGKTRREALIQADPWWERYPSIGRYFTGTVRAFLPRFFVEA